MADAPVYYCTACRSLREDYPAGGSCPNCGDEVVINVADPQQRHDVTELEERERERADTRWQIGMGVSFGFVGAAAAFGVLMAWAYPGVLGRRTSRLPTRRRR